MEELEISLMQIISYSGEARSLCFEALENYREGKKNTGLNLYKDAEENLYTAKRAHSKILQQFASGDFDQVSLLMVHAEDQMMACLLYTSHESAHNILVPLSCQITPISIDTYILNVFMYKRLI